MLLYLKLFIFNVHTPYIKHAVKFGQCLKLLLHLTLLYMSFPSTIIVLKNVFVYSIITCCLSGQTYDAMMRPPGRCIIIVLAYKRTQTGKHTSIQVGPLQHSNNMIMLASSSRQINQYASVLGWVSLLFRKLI